MNVNLCWQQKALALSGIRRLNIGGLRKFKYQLDQILHNLSLLKPVSKLHVRQNLLQGGGKERPNIFFRINLNEHHLLCGKLSKPCHTQRATTCTTSVPILDSKAILII